MSKLDTPHRPGETGTAPLPAGDGRTLLGLEIEIAERMMEPQWQAAEVAMLLTQEMMDFATRRVRAQVELFDTLSHCTDFNAVVEAQLKFLTDAGADCVDEISHLAKVTQARLAATGTGQKAA